jgi:hypothetical protein
MLNDVPLKITLCGLAALADVFGSFQKEHVLVVRNGGCMFPQLDEAVAYEPAAAQCGLYQMSLRFGSVRQQHARSLSAATTKGETRAFFATRDIPERSPKFATGRVSSPEMKTAR